MNIQDWISQLLAAAEPLDWERYSVTMEAATWKALWADVEATQGYDDGLEAALRLLQATHIYRPRLGPREADAKEILLYRSILSMLDKADRWETYLAVWETIWAHTQHSVLVHRDTLAGGDSRFTPFVREGDGGFGPAPRAYGEPLAKTVALHFLYTQSRRKTVIERKLGQKDTATLFAKRRPLGPQALSVEAIQSRLAVIHDPER